MIITRTPLRISLGGGGTDLPIVLPRGRPRLPHRGGDHEVRLHRRAPQLRRRRAAQVLRGRAGADGRATPSTRCCARASRVDRHRPGVEITSMADIPTGTGLGSSGSFTVGVLKALHLVPARARHQRRPRRARRATSRSTCSASRSASRTSTSPRSAASPAFEFHADERSRSCRSTSTPSPAIGSRTTSCCSSPAFGVRRPTELAEQQADRPPARVAARQPRPGPRDRLRHARRRSRPATSTASASCSTEQWQLKYERAPGAGARRGRRVDPPRASRPARSGGKLVGAGGGGFLLFYAEDKAESAPGDGRWPGSKRSASASTTKASTTIVSEP